MSKSDKAPDKVEHRSDSSVPGGFGLPYIHTTTIQKGGNTYTGKGWTEEESNKEAGEKYSKGDADKK